MIAPNEKFGEKAGGEREEGVTNEFLGSEFLTWLWWRSAEDPKFVHQDGTEVFLLLDEHMEWRGERSAARRTTLRSGVPGASVEARAAFRSGKSLVAARWLLARGEEEIRFTLRGEDLDVSGVKLPVAEGEDAAERLEGSLASLDRFFSDLDLCLRTFLDVRCGPAWDAEVARVRGWVARPSEDER